MIVITFRDSGTGITGQVNLICETFTTLKSNRGKGLFCSSSDHWATGESNDTTGMACT
jgi:hypothetical protein